MSFKVFCAFLLELADKVDLEQYRKSKREPKKPRPKRDKHKGSPHVSTARLLDAKK